MTQPNQLDPLVNEYGPSAGVQPDTYNSPLKSLHSATNINVPHHAGNTTDEPGPFESVLQLLFVRFVTKTELEEVDRRDF